MRDFRVQYVQAEPVLAMVRHIVVCALGFSCWALPYSLRASLYSAPENPRLEVEVDALLAKRTGVERRVLVKNSSSGTVMTTTTLAHRFDWVPGVQGSLMQYFDNGHALQAAVAWLDAWQASRIVQGTGGGTLSYPFTSSAFAKDYYGASAAHGSYRSQLWNGELNYWWMLTPRRVDFFSFATIFGLRGVYLGEHADLQFFKSVNRSNYWTSTRNRSLGVQVGANLQYNASRYWSVEITAKGAVLGTNAHGRIWLGDLNNTVALKSGGDAVWGASYILDSLVALLYRPTEYVCAHLAFQLLGYWNFALAPSMFAYSTSRTQCINNEGKFYLRAFALGCTWSF